jgi:hypothetical protein
MFVDRDAIEWGQEWRRRIDQSLAETTFFIPIITPRYFTRAECRGELLTFVAQANNLGFQDLVLPILYVPVADLSDKNDDDAVAAVARTQYVNWTALRLASPDSAEYRTAVNKLAQRLADAAEEIARSQIERESTLTDADENEPRGLDELVERIESLLPDWLSAVQADQIIYAQHRATVDAYNERLKKLQRANAPRGAQLAVLIQRARDDLPISERHLEAARIYGARSSELDPLVNAALLLVEHYPEGLPMLEALRNGVTEAVETIERTKRETEEVRGEAMVLFARRHERISRQWKQVAENHTQADALVDTANALVYQWDARLKDVASVDEGQMRRDTAST